MQTRDATAATVTTSNGAIDVESDSFDRLDLRTSNGRVRCVAALNVGVHQIRTSNGSNDLRVHGPAVRVSGSTSNGSVTIDGQQLTAKNFESILGSGPTADATLELRTSNGSVSVSHDGGPAIDGTSVITGSLRI